MGWDNVHGRDVQDCPIHEHELCNVQDMSRTLKFSLNIVPYQHCPTGPNRTCSMSTINPTTIQDVSQDPGTHPIGILDQNDNNNNNHNDNIISNQYISNRLQPSFINN